MMNCTRCQCLTCKAKDKRVEEIFYELNKMKQDLDQLKKENDKLRKSTKGVIQMNLELDRSLAEHLQNEDDEEYIGKNHAFKKIPLHNPIM